MNAIFVVLTVTGCLVPLLISFGYGITKLLEKNCSKNDDCLISEICENYKCINLCSKLECGRNEGCFAYNHTVSCKCAPGFSINTNKNETCQKFHYGTSCGIDYTETFYDDMCDKVQCNENEICLNHITNNNHSCECKFGYIPNSEQKCVKKVSSGCSTDKHCHFSEICKNGACVSACSDLNCNKMNFYTLNACLAYDHDATCGCGDGYLYDSKSKMCSLKSKITRGLLMKTVEMLMHWHIYKTFTYSTILIYYTISWIL